MHEDYEDDYNDYEDEQDKYKHYFKFDPEAWDAWGKLLYDSFNDIVESSPNVWYIISNIEGFPKQSFPVNSYFSNTGKEKKSFQYLGSNYDNAKIWKKKYFVIDPIQQEYVSHVQSNAAHFLKQPTYYRGLFDILN